MENGEPLTKACYCIRVEGALDESWAGWFSGMEVSLSDEHGKAPVTSLCGEVADQPALRGILSKLWDLNLTLISVIRLNTPVSKGGKSDECNHPIV